MADYDSSDLLARCKTLAQRPSTDQQQTDANWYSFLTHAQEHWMGQFAIHCAWTNMTAPILLTSADSGETYPFENDADSDDIFPLAVKLFDAKDGRLLRPGAYWDTAADYVWEGDKIRFAKGKTKTFSDGPYAIYVKPPNAISASSQPTLRPKRARKLLVYWAVAEWAARGGIRNPKPFYDLMDRAWFGNPNIGDLGLLGELKTQNTFGGVIANEAVSLGILEGVDDGSNYTPE